MPTEQSKRMHIGKWLLILLILLYVCMSFLDCTQQVSRYEPEIPGQDLLDPMPCRNNFSRLLIIGAAVQILLVLLNRYKLQVLPAIVAALPGLFLPVRIWANNQLADVIHFVAGNTPLKERILPTGWCVFAAAAVLLAASIFAAVWLSKQETEKLAENQNPDEGEESIV